MEMKEERKHTHKPLQEIKTMTHQPQESEPQLTPNPKQIITFRLQIKSHKAITIGIVHEL